MNYKKTIVCLANSWKRAGRCVAGRDAGGGGTWVRPVSARVEQEVSAQERQYQDGQEPRVLDIIEMELLRPVPKDHQQENHLIAPDRPWVKRGTATWAQLQATAESPATLWTNNHSSSNGINDGVALSIARTLESSLYIVRPDELTVTKALEPGFNSAPPKRKVRASFKFHGITYRFACTDPVVQSHLRDDEPKKFPEALLCVSLAAEDVSGYCYKLVAAVITPQRSGVSP